MKDFTLRNDTRLLFRSEPAADLKELAGGKRVLCSLGRANEAFWALEAGK